MRLVSHIDKTATLYCMSAIHCFIQCVLYCHTYKILFEGLYCICVVVPH